MSNPAVFPNWPDAPVMSQPGVTLTSKTIRRSAPTVSLVTAISIVIANMVGTGVFTSLGFQVPGLPSGFAILCLWMLGGVVALSGAFCYAELAAALPRSGGEYHFLSRVFHPALGFLAGWTSATVGFAAPIALAAMGFGTYARGLVPGISPLWLSLALVWGTSAVHFTGGRRGSAFHNWATVPKILFIAAFIVAGFLAPRTPGISFLPAPGDLHLMTGSAFAVSLVFVMYSYSGWNASTYIVNEIRDPERNVPRSLFLGTLAVLVMYVALNAIFLRVTPMHAMAGRIEVGEIAGAHIFGTAGGRVVAALISLGLISSVSSMVWTGPRVTVAMGEDLPGLALLAIKTRNGTPRVALALQAVIATLLLLTGRFEDVMDYVQLALILFAALTVLGVIVLRIREPGLRRPYRAWGYPFTPALFLIVSGIMIFYLITTKPWQSLAGIATVLAGLVIYFASGGRAIREKRVI
ncbi:MAG TPA: amino acid permease [Chthoniobacteraceae bacterium]|jgi:APA family basic amino acid/polyamine antiporter|nr:amino acid permease [Chthoniobacteraceae bacterium]